MDSLKLGSGPNSCMYSSAGSRRRAMVHPIETPSGPPGARRNLCAMAPGDLSEQLSAALAPVLGPGVHVEDLTRAPGGASRETWIFTARGSEGAGRRLVLRRDPAGTAPSGSRLEGELLRAAHRAG